MSDVFNQLAAWAHTVFVEQFDAWILLGFVAQAMFTMRFVVQWIASERAKRSVVPVAFWIFSLGGGALLLGNFEWRFPIAGPVGGTLFTDVGQVWREWGEFDAGELRWGAGVGVRYLSPIGPIRLEIGWKLDRQWYESPYVFFFSLGNPF